MSTTFEDWSTHHDVPADLTLAVDFMNTADHRGHGDFTPREFLNTPQDLCDWLCQHGFAAAELAPSDFDLALRLRSALRELAALHQDDNAPSEATVSALSETLALPLKSYIDSQGTIRLTGFNNGARGHLAAILAQVVHAEAAGTWRRVKMCAASDCRVVYYDYSRARNSRWCATTGCGNRAKTRTYRQRRRAQHD